jgi:seryl-tRNA synthetase
MTNEEIGMRLTEVDQRSKSNTHRIDKVEERQDNLDKLVASVAVMAQEQEHIKDDVTEIKSDVKTLAEKPAKRWDGLVEKFIWALAAAILGYVLAQFGIS